MNKDNHFISILIRIITIPPIIAFIMLTYLFLTTNTIFANVIQYSLTVLFLCIFPIAAYPLQHLFEPHFQNREGQRNLAMIFSVIGYVLGMIYTVMVFSSRALHFIYLGYLISGVAILISNKLLHFKISGHAVGTSGPIAILLGLGYSAWIYGIPILLCAFFSSLRAKRHSVSQLICGIILPFVIVTFLRYVL
ncbi:MAG: hypothetical protein WBL80_05715 [Erysipelotrichaceae bacterium]